MAAKRRSSWSGILTIHLGGYCVTTTLRMPCGGRSRNEGYGRAKRLGSCRPQDLMLTGQVQYDPCSDHYELLDVGSQASQADILRAYRRAVKRHHPDTGGDPSGQAVQFVYAAYAVLGNPYKRGHYDCSRNRYGRAPTRPRTSAARVAELPIAAWMRRAAAITLAVVAGALLFITAISGARPQHAQPTSEDITPQDGQGARAGGKPRSAAPFEYATAFEPDDAN